ncbi:pulmonary surfactant-associated protein D-like [Erythrolamprus reginae]|uniref:pulmonary surfactant-associated protein D-like n=1 Tax=Erythrolamprus reginae TaxID=121349 RepID=UPI00396C46FC
MLISLTILLVALEVSLQDTPKASIAPQDWLQNACMLIMCAPNKEDPRREMAIQGLQQFSSPSELLAMSAMNKDQQRSGTSDLELLKLQVKELRVQMDILKATFLKVQQAVLFPNGALVGEKMFKRANSKGDFQVATTICAHLSATLPLPRNAEENKALQDIVAWHKEPAILAITYNTAEGKFKDLKGQDLRFFNWARGEPNNLGVEKCVEMHPDGKWHNRMCDVGWSITCEISI